MPKESEAKALGDKLIGWREIHERTGLSRSKIYELMHTPENRGGLPVYNLAGCLRVKESDLLAWIERHKVRKGWVPLKARQAG